jgi:outer membrane protein TolC
MMAITFPPKPFTFFDSRPLRGCLLVTMLLAFTARGFPAPPPVLADPPPGALRTWSLAEILQAASTQTLSMSEHELGTRQLELGYESVRSELYPKVSLNSIYNLEYSGTAEDFRDDFTSTLNIYWNIFNLKTLLERKHRARLALENAREEKERVARKAVDRALELYFECWIFRRDLETLDRELEYQRSLYADEQLRFEKGLISREDLEAAFARIEDFEQKSRELRHGLEQARRRLRIFLRVAPEFRIAPPPRLEPPELDEFDFFFKEALRSSDEFFHAEKEIRNATESRDDQKWKRWKRLYSNFYFSDTVSLTEDDWAESFDRFRSGVSLSWRLPLFDGGDHRRGFEHSQIRVERALLNREETENRFTEMLYRAWTGLKDAERRLARKKEYVAERADDVRFLESRVRDGTISRREFDKASLMLARARLELEKMHCEHVVQKAAFFHLCGQDTPWLYPEN